MCWYALVEVHLHLKYQTNFNAFKLYHAMDFNACQKLFHSIPFMKCIIISFKRHFKWLHACMHAINLIINNFRSIFFLWSETNKREYEKFSSDCFCFRIQTVDWIYLVFWNDEKSMGKPWKQSRYLNRKKNQL